MPKAAEVKFDAAGIDISRLKTTGDAAYFSQYIAAFCRGECSEKASSFCLRMRANATGVGVNPA